MWFALFLIAAAAVAFFGSLFGLGFLAIPLGLVIAAGALWLMARGAKETSGGTPLTGEASPEYEGQAPQDTEHSGRYVVKGPAHEGQKAMTGEQIEADAAARR